MDEYTESFETGFGSWIVDPTSYSGWVRQTGGTSSSSTGPSGAYSGSYYVFVETSNGSSYTSGNTDILEYSFPEASRGTINFWYNQYGADQGTLYLEKYDGSAWSTLWSSTGDQGTAWINVSQEFSEAEKIRFRNVAAGGYHGDVALDLIYILVDNVLNDFEFTGTTAFLKGAFHSFYGSFDPEGSADLLRGFLLNAQADVSLTGSSNAVIDKHLNFFSDSYLLKIVAGAEGIYRIPFSYRADDVYLTTINQEAFHEDIFRVPLLNGDPESRDDAYLLKLTEEFKRSGVYLTALAEAHQHDSVYKVDLNEAHTEEGDYRVEIVGTDSWRYESVYLLDIGDPPAVVTQPVEDTEGGEVDGTPGLPPSSLPSGDPADTSVIVYPTPQTGRQHEIYLNGRPILAYLDEFRIVQSQEGQTLTHNTITFSGSRATFLHPDMGEDIYDALQSIALTGEGILTFRHKASETLLHFLLEEVEDSDDGISWEAYGRGLISKYSERYHGVASVSPDTVTPVEEVFTDLFEDFEVRIDGFELDTPFDSTGSPLQIAVDIAAVPDAVLRDDGLGKVILRRRYPVRPVHVADAEPVARYDRVENIFSVGREKIKGTPVNAVEIIGKTTEIPSPDVESVDAEFIGETVSMKVYWPTGTREGSVVRLSQSDGSNGVYPYTFPEERTETVTFLSGKGSVGKPIRSLKEIKWYGKSYADPIFSAFGKELTLETDGDGIAEVTYETQFERVDFTQHNVEKLLTVFRTTVIPDVAIVVSMGDDMEITYGDPITDSRLNSVALATERGTAYLDKTAFDYMDVVVEAPYNEKVKDGEIVYVSDVVLGISHNAHVLLVETYQEGAALLQSVKVRVWLL